jgi:RNase P subunit RPR2
MKTQGELFRAFLVSCPHCGSGFVYRINLDGPHCGNYIPTRCSSCKEIVSRRELLRARIRGEADAGVSFDCHMCGRSNFFVGRAGACSFCGEQP